VPNMVLTAHVHNYQRIERLISKEKIPFLVVGHGGYYHLHGLTADPGKNGVDPDTKAHLVEGNDKQHGYVTLTVDKQYISGIMTTVTDAKRQGEPKADAFSYSAKLIELDDKEVVSL